ncbi:MAG: carbamoyltransferase [Deltaproteobacteria bacterium]|nr:carbamoyltransferase [Deltaproteobacteria bacterium]
MSPPTFILGISGLYHDSAAALLRDGRLVAAAQEERFTRKKHDAAMPVHAIASCLREAGIDASRLSYVVFYEKPLQKFDRLIETELAFAPWGFRQFLMAAPKWIRERLHIPRELDRALGTPFTGKYIFTAHHESHAASAFFPSPFNEAAIVTLDGVGEWTTTSIGVGRGNTLKLLYELRFPHSLGLLYSAFTYFTGFKVNSGEYKLMGLAPYGKPVYRDKILKHLIDIKKDGSFRLNMEYFAYCYSDVMVGRKFARLFDGPRRTPESPITQREMDLAASIQSVTEEIMLRIARFTRETTGLANLVMAGGVALNCCGNGRILREGLFDKIWIQPAAGDAGGALGAALFVHHQLLGNGRSSDNKSDRQFGSFLGSEYSDREIRRLLDARGAVYHFYSDEDALLERVAEAIAQGQVVGWFHGRMEFGPRALGGRSILGDARVADMQSRMNLKIKFRESFRPFAPSVLREHTEEFFELHEESPYMLLVAPVAENQRLDAETSDAGKTILERLKKQRSTVPGITHVDYSARVQTVDPVRHGRYYRLLKRFFDKTGCPLVINTSFNIRGEPIVQSPADALRCFLATDMDVLALESCVLLKTEQTAADRQDRERYMNQFELD